MLIIHSAHSQDILTKGLSKHQVTPSSSSSKSGENFNNNLNFQQHKDSCPLLYEIWSCTNFNRNRNAIISMCPSDNTFKFELGNSLVFDGKAVFESDRGLRLIINSNVDLKIMPIDKNLSDSNMNLMIMNSLFEERKYIEVNNPTPERSIFN